MIKYELFPFTKEDFISYIASDEELTPLLSPLINPRETPLPVFYIKNAFITFNDAQSYLSFIFFSNPLSNAQFVKVVTFYPKDTVADFSLNADAFYSKELTKVFEVKQNNTSITFSLAINKNIKKPFEVIRYRLWIKTLNFKPSSFKTIALAYDSQLNPLVSEFDYAQVRYR